MAKNMMPNMKGQAAGYKPPTGSAGSEAKGEYSFSSNPRPTPMKGSQISAASNFGTNSDRAKVKSLQSSQAAKESLRGKGC